MIKPRHAYFSFKILTQKSESEKIVFGWPNIFHTDQTNGQLYLSINYDKDIVVVAGKDL